MKPPVVSVFTPSFNKHEYVLEAIESVLGQSYKHIEFWLAENSTDNRTRTLVKSAVKNDPRVRYLEFDFSDEERQTTNIPARLQNIVYPKVTGDYLFYLSDDDLLHHKCLEIMVNYLESHVDHMVCYHAQRRMIWTNDQFIETEVIPAVYKRGFDTIYPEVDSRIDGVQILHRTRCLDHLDQPYISESLADGRHTDGIFMQHLANLWTFYPVGVSHWLSIHRITPKSTWTRP